MQQFMDIVYDEVEIAISEGNPPFAAVIVDKNGQCIAKAHNQTITKKSVVFHAEIEVILLSCRILQKQTLEGCTLYTNAESCCMCSGAIIKSGIERVVYGAPSELKSNPNIYLREINEHSSKKLIIENGIMEERFMEQICRGRLLIKKKSR